jgi:hypothetical protein
MQGGAESQRRTFLRSDSLELLDLVFQTVRTKERHFLLRGLTLAGKVLSTVLLTFLKGGVNGYFVLRRDQDRPY